LCTEPLPPSGRQKGQSVIYLFIYFFFCIVLQGKRKKKQEKSFLLCLLLKKAKKGGTKKKKESLHQMYRLGVSRVLSTTTGTAAAALCAPKRLVKTTDPTYEDDRWLEAQIADASKTPEERYAAEKQKTILKNMMSKMREEHKDHVEAVRLGETAKRNEEVGNLKKQLADLQHKISEILSKGK
jgi:polyhydroxyalkanoate synthesis regulator phasin